MVRKLFALAIAAMALSLVATADDKKTDKKADKKKTTKLEGKLACTKCELQETKACGHALLVQEKKDGKEVEVKYYLKDKGAKEPFHSKICTEPKPATVTGVVKDEKIKDKPDEKRKVIEDAKVEIK